MVVASALVVANELRVPLQFIVQRGPHTLHTSPVVEPGRAAGVPPRFLAASARCALAVKALCGDARGARWLVLPQPLATLCRGAPRRR